MMQKYTADKYLANIVGRPLWERDMIRRLLITLSCGFAACHAPPTRGQEPTRASEAVSLVDRFLAADTAGDAQGAEALVFPSPPGGGVPYCELGTDGLEITRSARVLSGTPHGDTVEVVAEYRILGVAWSEDTHDAGPKNWRFNRAVSHKRVTFHVFKDAQSNVWIACGPRIPANHPGISQWRKVLARLDAHSLEEWNAALTEASTLDSAGPGH
jgi:hypothetical protein